MRSLKIETVNADGEVLHYSDVSINKSRKLIVHTPKGMHHDTIQNIHEEVVNAMEDDNIKVITVPHGVTFSALRVN